MHRFATGLATGFGMATAGMAVAEVPRVVADIPPVHSLVAQVMDGVGEPSLLMRPGASPHGYSLRPSEAAALEKAGLVVWVGPSLTPWLDGAIDTLGGGSTGLELAEVDGTLLLKHRSGATFEAHDHAHDDHGDEDHDEHAHDEDHDGHDHDEHAHDEDHDGHDHDEHAHDEDHDAHEGHDHGEHAHDADSADPHMWLDPANGKVWLTAIAASLSDLDPDNAAAYAANAEAGIAAIDAAEAEAKDELAGLQDAPFIVFHDAYQYFEGHFGVAAAGAISLGDASSPGPARVQEVQQTVRDLDVVCVFAEPQFNPRLTATVSEGSGARSAVLDPLGADLPLGAGLYPDLLRELAHEMADCLKG